MMFDAASGATALSPMGVALIRTFTGWVGLLTQLAEQERRRVAAEAIRILAAHLPCAERQAVLAALASRN